MGYKWYKKGKKIIIFDRSWKFVSKKFLHEQNTFIGIDDPAQDLWVNSCRRRYS